MKISYLALLCGFILDLMLGDPYSMPHIIKLMGSTISFIEKLVYPKNLNDITASKLRLRFRGLVLVIAMLVLYGVIPFFLIRMVYRFSICAGFVIETFICYQMLAAKSLYTESMKVYKSLKDNNIEDARKNVSMIVGRDTDKLDEEGITKAAVETVAENTSDGVIAPLLYMMLGGAALGMAYKAINTMDSMIGYKNDRYIYFGTVAAKLDDVVNFFPARVSAILMIFATFVLRLNTFNACRIFARDRYNHKSPNSAQTESVCAGALGVKLAGNAYYFGKIYEKPYIGDEIRKIECEDIRRANRLMFGTEFIVVLIAAVVYVLICI